MGYTIQHDQQFFVDAQNVQPMLNALAAKIAPRRDAAISQINARHVAALASIQKLLDRAEHPEDRENIQRIREERIQRYDSQVSSWVDSYYSLVLTQGDAPDFRNNHVTFCARVDTDGNLIALWHRTSTIESYAFCDAIAPFVRSGSWLEFEDDDRDDGVDVYRSIFENGEVEHSSPRLSW